MAKEINEKERIDNMLEAIIVTNELGKDVRWGPATKELLLANRNTAYRVQYKGF